MFTSSCTPKLHRYSGERERGRESFQCVRALPSFNKKYFHFNNVFLRTVKKRQVPKFLAWPGIKITPHARYSDRIV